MSGRHKMPPAGRRKAATDSGDGAEEVIEEVIADEPEGSDEVDGAPDADDAEVEVAEVEDTEEAGADAPASVEEPAEIEKSHARSRVSLPVVLAVIALVLAVAAGVLRWLTVSQDESATARDESVQAAKEITTEMLSYETETVEQQLTAARDRMTGEFLGTYTAMINEIIPEAHAQQIAAVADVLRTGTVSVKPDRAEMVLYINQSVQVGNHMPQKTPSIARVTMVKVGDRWLMSKYEPVPM